MARDFDGTNDRVDFGSDPSIDDWTTLSFAVWIAHDVAANDALANKGSGLAGNNGWALEVSSASPGVLAFNRSWTTTRGNWTAGSIPTNGTRTHVAVVYDGSLTTNDPEIYVNGVLQTETETATPAGSLGTDGAATLRIGESAGGGTDFDGRHQNVNFANALFDAAAVNRAKWWGRPHGGINVYHPFFTTKLANEGSATANGTVTGTTVAAFPTPVQRPGSALMGMGCGW